MEKMERMINRADRTHRTIHFLYYNRNNEDLTTEKRRQKSFIPFVAFVHSFPGGY